jgi:predicted transcriptional regulator of viral defense system
MKPERRTPRARQYVNDLAATGRYHFALNDAQEALGVSPSAAKVALHRLAEQAVLASPARGFYVVVPPEYRSLRCLPADQFIPALMTTSGLRYYAGLLTAAQYHGAAHQRPQAFQVFLERQRQPIACGKVSVAFMTRKRLPEVPLQSINTPRGTLLVSTAEATAVDLVGYPHHSGGLDNVATVLSELALKIDPEKLAAAATTAPVPWAQRLGYLLDLVGAGEKTAHLKDYVRICAHESAPLLVKAPRQNRARRPDFRRSEDWKLYINVDVEPDL